MIEFPCPSFLKTSKFRSTGVTRGLFKWIAEFEVDFTLLELSIKVDRSGLSSLDSILNGVTGREKFSSPSLLGVRG